MKETSSWGGERGPKYPILRPPRRANWKGRCQNKMEDGCDGLGSVGVKILVLCAAGVYVFMVKEDQASFWRPRARLREQLDQCVGRLANRVRYLWVRMSGARAHLHAQFGW